MEKEIGAVYLIPTFLSDVPFDSVMAPRVRDEIRRISYFAVENEKTARRYIKKVVPEKDISSLVFYPIGKHSDDAMISSYLAPCLQGHDLGVISEAGVPAVADPGALVVERAHGMGIRVIPLCGPSSVLMGLMASGLSGQCFAFNGYLPVDKAGRRARLRELEALSLKNSQAQIFIETPYRNVQMFDDILSSCASHTSLCVASDITGPDEYIRTMTVAGWKSSGVRPDIHKKPTVFIIQQKGVKK